MIEKSEAWINLLVARGPALRAAGVTELSIDGVSVTLAPADVQVPTDDGKTPALATSTTDPLDDDSTFGGRGMPGFVRPPMDGGEG